MRVLPIQNRMRGLPHQKKKKKRIEKKRVKSVKSQIKKSAKHSQYSRRIQPRKAATTTLVRPRP